MNDPAASFWLAQARRNALRHNLGWWLSAFLPLGAALSLTFAGLVLLLRHIGALTPLAWGLYALALVGAAMLAAGRVRTRFSRRVDALARLDVHLGLQSRLVAAAAGVGRFPPPQPARDGRRWRWSALVLPILGSVAALLAAAWVPIRGTPDHRLPVEPPPALADVAAWVEELSASETVEDEAIERVREQTGELAAKPESEWYSQASLEAGDTLREQVGQAIEALRRDLEAASHALGAAAQLDPTASPALRENVGLQLSTALDRLAAGNLPLDGNLLRELRSVDPSTIRRLDPKQLAALQDRLAKGQQACAACVGPGNDPFSRVAGNSESGSGGINRGPGHEPLGRAPAPTDLRTTQTQALAGGDLSRALPAEVLGVDRSAPPVDPAAPPDPGSTAGGAASAGSGGEAVWRHQLTPAERAALQRFFK